MKGVRDTQRSKLYKAERTLPEFRKMDFGTACSTDKLQVWVTHVLARKRVVARFGHRSIRVTHNQGRGGAHGGFGVIHMATYYRNKLITLHEMAHCLAGAYLKHSWQYAEVYLFLVREVMGVEVATRLKKAFKSHRVRFREPVKRELTDAQRDVLRDRLAATRGITPAVVVEVDDSYVQMAAGSGPYARV